ncbi:hypothetical protein D3C87_1878690 [compost metagenome]
MREGRAIEVEAQRIVRASGGAFQPQEPGVGSDEALDQPGACHAVHPQVAAGGPNPPLILGRIPTSDCSRERLWLARGLDGLDGAAEVIPLCFGAGGRLIGEEVDRADRFVGTPVTTQLAVEFDTV